MELKIAVIGCGMIGREHIERIQNRIRGAEVVAVCDVFEEGAKKGAEIAGGNVKVYTDFNAAINDPDVNAVVVTTPGAFHKDPVIAAIQAGKPVFSEKPLGNTAADCKAVVDAEIASGKHLVQVGFMRRYDPSYADAKAQIDAGKIGKPYLVKATGLDPEALVESCIKFSKTSGGIFIDAASHDIDLMRWFLGGEVTEVYAAGTTFKHPEFTENGDTETGMAMLKFDNGTVAFLHVGRTAPHGYHTETEIVATEGHIRVAGVPWKDRVMVYDQYGARQEIVENFPQRFAEAYLLEMVDFIDCIQKGRKPELTVYDGTKATIVTYAITDSFHSGKAVKVEY